MLYKKVDDLPDSVKNNLPQRAQEIYKEAFNSAWEQYGEPRERRSGATREETAHKVAWAAVKRKFERDEQSGVWKPRKGD